MPFKPVENPKCPKCGKSVYAAEERVAGGYKFHKSCFKCGLCGKFLDSTNVTEHEAELYCKNCHARKYGPKGYGFGGGAGCLSMDTGAQFQGEDDVVVNRAVLLPKAIAKAPDGEGCPKCGGFVYAAEQMLARGRGWHKLCFRCGNCERWLDSTSHCDGPDGSVYCNADRRPRSLSPTRPPSRPRRAKAAPVAEEWSSPPKRCWPKGGSGIVSASSAAIAPKPWIPSSLAMGPIVMFTARLAMARSGDLTVMASLAEAGFCKLMV
ncbi:muscle LIM protein Mlp84B-like isoform X5 [Euwallacea similis]|uniref:muscle LIM protein Mlp84B-like isoform X5 n=1 Tax=Euwallacea similis TaxID=1736056 RepID=UPI00344D30EB